MLTKLTLQNITINNFKNIKNWNFSFSQKNIMQGVNGVGKTTILDAIAFVLADTSVTGNDFNPVRTVPNQPIEKGFVTLTVKINNDSIILTKLFDKKGKVSYRIDNIAVTTKTQFNEFLKSKNIYNIQYSMIPSTLLKLKTDQLRDIFVQNLEIDYKKDVYPNWAVTPSIKTEAIKYLESANYNIDLALNNVRTQKVIFENDASRLTTLTVPQEFIFNETKEELVKKKEELEIKQSQVGIKLKEVSEHYALLSEKTKEKHKLETELNVLIRTKKESKNMAIAKLNASIDNARAAIDSHQIQLNKWTNEKDQALVCSACKRPFNRDRVEKALYDSEMNNRILSSKNKIILAKNQIKDYTLQLKLLTNAPLSYSQDDIEKAQKYKLLEREVNELSGKAIPDVQHLDHSREITAIIAKIQDYERIKKAQEDHRTAVKQLTDLRKNINDLDLIVNALRVLKITVSEAIEHKASKLINNYDISLFKPTKTTGELKPIFSLSKDGIGYDGGLNTSARLRASIELCCAYQAMLNIDAPLLIDGAEVISDDIEYYGKQLVISRTTKDKELSVLW